MLFHSEILTTENDFIYHSITQVCKGMFEQAGVTSKLKPFRKKVKNIPTKNLHICCLFLHFFANFTRGKKIILGNIGQRHLCIQQVSTNLGLVLHTVIVEQSRY